MVYCVVKRKIIRIDKEKCNGCGQCILNCAEGALRVINGKARLVSDVYCDGLGACIGHCPQDALEVIEREASEFDEEAVHEHLQSQAEEPINCTTVKSLHPDNRKESSEVQQDSALRQWPVQLNLVPIKAPFWNNTDLLLMADCVAVAQPQLHSKLINGRSIMVGCPKFDDAQHFADKLTQILKHNNVRNLTVAVMEVPCCSGLRRIAQLALQGSGKMLPTQNLVVSVDGSISKN